MTALSLNLHTAKPLDLSGIPLEGLPPLEAGRTLPHAFAEALGKLTDDSEKAPVGAVPEGEAAPQAAASVRADVTAQAVPARIAPDILVEGNDHSSQGKAANPAAETLSRQGASGKGLPPARPDLATPTGTPAAATAHAPAPSVAARIQDGPDEIVAKGAPPAAPSLAAQAPATGDAQTTEASRVQTSNVVATPVRDSATAPQPAANGVAEGVGASAAAPEAVVPAARAASVLNATLPLAAPIMAQAAIPGGPPRQIRGELRSASSHGHGAVATTAAPSVTADVARSLAPAAPEQTASGSIRQDVPVTETGRRAQPNPELTPQTQTRTTAETPVQARMQAETAQTGLSLHLRAADRPMALTEPGVSAASTGTATASAATAPAIAGPLAGTPLSTMPHMAGPQAGAVPNFPDLAALVDRISAARDSTGSASATIAVAHKELGNLSLTFETTGRTLDVEVAAKDSDTQRALAAAIAADRPQLRVADGPAQPGAQQAQGNSQAGGQGTGAGTAEQSGTAGDTRQDRRDQRRDGNGAGPDRHADRQSKSDGGIYA